MRQSVSALTALVLAGCAVPSSAPVVGIAVAPPQTSVAPPPTGVILLPTSSTQERNAKVCLAFFGALDDVATIEGRQPYAINVIKTFWIDKRSSPPGPAALKACDTSVLNNYDQERANNIITQLSPTPSGVGPFLVGYDSVSGKPKLMLNGSDQTSDAQIKQLVSLWVTAAAQTTSDASSAPSGLQSKACSWAQKVETTLNASSSILANVAGLLFTIGRAAFC